MMNRLNDRKAHIGLFLSIVFIALVVRLAVVTIIQGDDYVEKSLNYRLKKIPEYAKRGEIFDASGLLLAGNQPAFTVNLMGSNLTKDQLSEVSIKLIDLLNSKNEAHIEFPISVENGKFIYSFDVEKEKWLTENGYPKIYTAKDVFLDYREKEQISEQLNDKEAYSIMITKGIILPISISKMKFWSELEKTNFLKMYQLNQDVPADVAFRNIRNYKTFKIDPKISNEQAYKILILKHALKEKGFLKYEPIKVANNVKKETAIMVSELSMDMNGVSIGVEPVRIYPLKNTASHILGYMGKIAREDEIQKYVVENNYEKHQVIGKVGLEGRYEMELNGDNGYKFIEVDASGRMVREIETDVLGQSSQPSKAGDDIYLTIDSVLQQNLEKYLKQSLESIQVGGTFPSKYGNYKYSEAFPNAKTAAGIVVNVKNGQVLAMASYPDYDLNAFSTGISGKDWEKLSPENPKNPLSPRPLFNMATMTGVQPGSTYKMATAYGALQQGLDPYRMLYDDGFIELGGHSFGCWWWNGYHQKHGYVNLFTALEQSCNYYFFDIGSGMDYAKGGRLNYNISSKILLDHSKDLGLNTKTGLEIEEISTGVPDPENKKKAIQSLLKSKLKAVLKDYFTKDKIESEEALEALVDKIVSWSNESPSRTKIIKNLEEAGATPATLEKLADIIKYDYFNQMKFHEGDVLNLSIGQGDHQYTVAQMARYMMIIANDGYPYELGVVKKVGEKSIDKTQGVQRLSVKNPKTFEYIRTAMKNVTSGPHGTARGVFGRFPISVGAKTGTAQKSGKIPPKDEVQYFKQYLRLIDGNLSFAAVTDKTTSILKIRNEEIARIKKNIEVVSTEENEKKLEKKMAGLITRGYLTEESAMRQAIKELSKRNLTDDHINAFRSDYDNFSWFVSFAPYDNPEIAVVVLIPQGGHGGYAAPPAREIIGDYFKLPPTNSGTINVKELNTN